MKTLVSCMAAAMLAVTAQAWAQGRAPAAANPLPTDGAQRAAGSAAIDVAPGSANANAGSDAASGAKNADRGNKRSRRASNPPVTQGARSSETYDYPVPAPKSRP